MKFIATTALAALLACPASAAPNCAATIQVEAVLVEKYGEEVITLGITETGELMRWWGNEHTGTWTVTSSKGLITCIMASGGAHERLVLAPNL